MGLGTTGEGLRAFLYLQNNTRGAGVNKKSFAYTYFRDLEKVLLFLNGCAILKVGGPPMTIEKERERRANQIVRNADIYGGDEDFRKMVDNTVYLTGEQRVVSERVIGRVYGSRGYGLSGDGDGA
jgi:hypothetical protein